MGTPLSRTVKPPAYLPNIQSASTRHSPMSPSQMPANTGIGILLGATLLFSALSGATALTLPIDETGTIEQTSVEVTEEFTGKTCLSFTLRLTDGANENFMAAMYTTTNANAMSETEYATAAALVADAEEKAVKDSLCSGDDFKKFSVCSRVVKLTESEKYVAAMANGDTKSLAFDAKVEDCSTTSTVLIEETGEIAPTSVVVSPEDTGLRCLKVTLSMTDGETNDDVIAGIYKKTDADSMKTKKYSTPDEVFTDMQTKGVTGSVCKFDSSATCTKTITLTPTETYLAAIGNKGDVSYTGKMKVESCTDQEALNLGLTDNPPSQGYLAAGNAGVNPYLANGGPNGPDGVVSGAETISRVALTALLAAMLLLAM